jgi:L-iditol 2-dehydrogenase
MQVVTIEGERRARIEIVPDPVAHGDMVVVKVLVAPTCTEYKQFAAGAPVPALGHEAAGEVVDVAGPSTVAVGDRVVVMPRYSCGRCSLCLSGNFVHCLEQRAPARAADELARSTYAQFLHKPDWLLVRIPEGMSLEHAAMACCGLGPSFGAMERLGVSAPENVLITGMGPVGLGAVINAAARGARIVAVEPNAFRAELARSLGAELVVDPRDSDAAARIREFTGNVGVDKAVDCSGSPAAQRLLIDATRPCGSIAFVGEGGSLDLDTSRDLLRTGLTLHGSWHYNLGHVHRLLQLIARVPRQIDALITHRFPLARATEAWELQLTGACGKVLLHPWPTPPERSLAG